MRSMCRILVASAVAALAFPQLAMADDIEEQLRLMNERMSQLEDQLQATKDELDDSRGTIERQQELIEKAEIGEGEAKSGLDDFFTKIEVGGWVAASYWYNFNQPRDINQGANQGADGLFYPYRPDHNSFQVDQVWFEIEKPVTEESRAGFRLDMVYGKTAGLLNDNNDNADPFRDAASDFNLFQAYIQYLVPFGNMTLKAGKFATIVGAETPATVYNFNVTMGNLFNLMQPVTHYGVILEGEVGSFFWKIGGVNEATCSGFGGNCSGNDSDNNDTKSLLAGAGYTGETFSIGTSILWGVDSDDDEFLRSLGQIGVQSTDIAEFGTTGDSGFGETGLVDVLATWDPTERISTWLNFNYRWEPKANRTGIGNDVNPDGWGLAVAARLGLTESLGFAVRGEYLQDSDNMFGFFGADSLEPGFKDVDVAGITGTLDWTITDGLVAKAEVRWDSVTVTDGRDQAIFVDNNKGDGGPNGPQKAQSFNRSDQVVAGVELTYQF